MMRTRASETLSAGKEVGMWIKPEFEMIELCMEVTTYMHHR